MQLLQVRKQNTLNTNLQKSLTLTSISKQIPISN